MANVNFNYNDAGENTKVYFEKVLGEKPGGGYVAAPTFDVAPATAVYYDSANNIYKPIKAARLLAANEAASTSLKVAKGSGIVKSDVLGYGSKAVAVTAVNTSNADYDTLTITMGVAIAKGEVLYQASAASADAAAPIGTPVYVTGNECPSGKGDINVRLVNIANVRKETANFGKDIAKLLPTINLV